MAAAVIGDLNRANGIVLPTPDGGSLELSSWWLRNQCPCPMCRTESGQNTNASLSQRGQDPQVAQVQADQAGRLEIVFRDGHRSVFAQDELLALAGWRQQPAPFGFSSRRPLELVRRRWVQEPSDATVHDWLSVLGDNQILVLEGAPSRLGVVGATAAQIAPVMTTIYGDSWLVRADETPENIAYTACALPFHQDLCAYETPPGLQLLHCVEFAAEVVGGQTWFCDAVLAAERVRVAAPEDFDTLCQVWATFATVNRKHHMKVRKPHLVIDDHGSLVAINWAPPFEGPFAGPAADEARYRRAYQTFVSAIEACPRVELRLQPGEIVVFHNRRALHARAGFSQAGGAAPRRLFEGCYLSGDDVANRYQLLARSLVDPSARPAQR